MPLDFSFHDVRLEQAVTWLFFFSLFFCLRLQTNKKVNISLYRAKRKKTETTVLWKIIRCHVRTPLAEIKMMISQQEKKTQIRIYICVQSLFVYFYSIVWCVSCISRVLLNGSHTHTHTHLRTSISMRVYIDEFIASSSLTWPQKPHDNFWPFFGCRCYVD